MQVPEGQDLVETPVYYGPCGVVLGRLRARRTHKESESGSSAISMRQMKDQGWVNSDTACTPQQHRPVQYAIASNAQALPAPEQSRSTKPAIQIYDLTDEFEDDDVTSFHPDQDKWSLESLPDILYALKPDHKKCRHRIRTTEHDVFGNEINIFAVLPSQISSKVEGWRLEAWMRLDRRITVQDIIDRVHPKYRLSLTPDEIELRRKAFREKFFIACWGAKKSVNEIRRLTKSKGIDPALNTTRGLTPGLIDPSRGEAGGRIPLPSKVTYDTIPSYRSYPEHSYGPAPMRSRLIARFPHLISPVFINDSDRSTATNSPETIYQLHWEPSPSPRKRPSGTNRKRRISSDVTSVEYLGTRMKKTKMSTPQSVFDFNSYPATLRELTSHKGPPARVFPTQSESVETIMSLDEYLHTSQLSFWEYLDIRCENSLMGVKRWSLRSRR
ncbi:hypothetical protein BBP40_006314 [Aspergillus hancockii]|nr:hypothetical protein BBP40_006314 [Aspergillus hancockii]